MNLMDNIEAGDLKKGLPQLTPGDTVRVHVRVKETSVKEEIKGKPKETERERVQIFEGIVIGLRGAGARATMTVRKVSFGQGVERIFPLHAKTIEKIEVVKRGDVRRAKLADACGLGFEVPGFLDPGLRVAKPRDVADQGREPPRRADLDDTQSCKRSQRHAAQPFTRALWGQRDRAPAGRRATASSRPGASCAT